MTDHTADPDDLLYIPDFLKRAIADRPTRRRAEPRKPWSMPRTHKTRRAKRKAFDQVAALKRLDYSAAQCRRVSRSEAGEIIARRIAPDTFFSTTISTTNKEAKP